MLFPVLYVSAKVITKVPLVRPSEMDFKSGVSEIDAITSVLVLLEYACNTLLTTFLDMTIRHRRTGSRLCGYGWQVHSTLCPI